MKVLILSTGHDTGGQGFRIREAFARHEPSWTVDALAIGRNPLGYPSQFGGPVSTRVALAGPLYHNADVVHLRLNLGAFEKWGKADPKPIILHHHGTIFRTMHHALGERARRIGAVQVASTIDLTMLEPGVTWLPSPYNLAELAAIRERVYEPSDRIRIVHAPTNRSAKHTALFEYVTKRLAREYPIDVDIIEGVPWAECLERKAKADILYDQLNLGYGNNAVEAWGMGIPVISGVSDPAVKARMEETWGGLPFLDATPETFEAKLRPLIADPALRAVFAARGAAHVARFHSEERVVAILKALYETAPASVWSPIPGPLSGRERRERAAA